MERSFIIFTKRYRLTRYDSGEQRWNPPFAAHGYLVKQSRGGNTEVYENNFISN